MNPVTAACAATFGIVEALFHTLGGLKSYKMFKSKGKETLYTPGSLTLWYLFVPLAIVIYYQLISRHMLNPIQWIIGTVGATIVILITIQLPAQLLKNPDSPYPMYKFYKGYFAKFDQ